MLKAEPIKEGDAILREILYISADYSIKKAEQLIRIIEVRDRIFIAISLTRFVAKVPPELSLFLTSEANQRLAINREDFPLMTSTNQDSAIQFIIHKRPDHADKRGPQGGDKIIRTIIYQTEEHQIKSVQQELEFNRYMKDADCLEFITQSEITESSFLELNAGLRNDVGGFIRIDCDNFPLRTYDEPDWYIGIEYIIYTRP